jgi:transposase
MFVRKKRNQSGSVSIQILEKRGRKNHLVETVGCSHEPKEVEALYAKARRRIDELRRQPTLPLESSTSRTIDDFLETLCNDDIHVVGPELIFGTLFDRIGLNAIEDTLFRDVVITRIVYGGSKRRVTEYLRLYRNKPIETDRIYRLMDRIHRRYKEKVETILFAHTKKVLGVVHVVFYDMTTLYFEAEEEDDFRKVGFSKDGKFQNPQILLGLLVGERGYPIGYELFEGNTFEGHTLIPVLEAFQKKFDLKRPIVVADSGLLSKTNLEELEAKGYGYILGARIKKEKEAIIRQIHAWHLSEDGAYRELKKEDGTRLIVTYSAQRAKKDAYNRKRGLQRLEKKIKSGTLSKAHINARGYNKYLKLDGEVDVSIDYAKYEADGAWDGLKGYWTNTDLSAETVIENYANLWQIEKAFRMSKSDLKIRPIYHRVRKRIEAHICIAFAAYGIYKELERRLDSAHAPFGLEYAKELCKSIYGLSYQDPDSQEKRFKLLKLSEEQELLYRLVTQPDDGGG